MGRDLFQRQGRKSLGAGLKAILGGQAARL